ncbi:MAG: zinc ribbon domain-containing protein [Clostridiales bacterium]|nr:zinc ribbon domain-containing protein [Clostridiales bacterium]
MICPKCESSLPDGVKFCPSCGASVLSEAVQGAVSDVASEVKDEVAPEVIEEKAEAVVEEIKQEDDLPNASFDPGAPIAIPKKKEEAVEAFSQPISEAAPEVAAPVVAPVAEFASQPVDQPIIPTPAPAPAPSFQPAPEVNTSPAGVAPIPVPAPLTPSTFPQPSYTPAPVEEKKGKKSKGEADTESKPLSTGGAFWLLFLFAIPVVGFISSIIFSVSGKKQSRKNLSRAVLIWKIIGIIIVLATCILLYFLIKPAFEAIMEGDYNGFIDELYDAFGL